jgi:hypothetical protein
MMIRRLLAVAALATLTACFSVQVNHDFNPKADFAALQTFDWMPESDHQSDSSAADDLRERRFRTATEAYLTEKGFRKVTSGADFVVGYHLTVENEVDFQTVNTYWGPRWDYGGMYPDYYGGYYGGGMAPTRSTARGYLQGTLIIDIFDVESEELVWRGVGEAQMEPDWTPQERDQNSRKAVRAILAAFPPNG